MKKKKRKIEAVILAIVFVAAVIIFSFLTNRGDENTTVGLDGASCPQVSFEMGGYQMNQLEGYVKEMDVTVLRDTITPVIYNQVTAVIDAHDAEITGIDYAVYSLDGKEKLYEDTISKPQEEVKLEFSGEDLLEDEKVLKLTLYVGEEKEIYYYTRIVDASDANLKICLDYANDFHTNALQKLEDQGVETAIETTANGNEGALSHVTINSDFDHVSWGKLEPQVIEKVRWKIKELKNSYTCLELEYQVAGKGEENEQDAYRVEEFFKIRHSAKAKKTYLLEYDRKMNQIFDPIGQVLGKKGIILGIADENISYKSNKDGTIVSFVQANELWSYHKEKNEMTLIFSFDAEEGYDERNLLNKHEIEILNHSNKGNIRFAVKGYMNRGNHEGEVGVAVYYYDANEKIVTEEAFVAYDRALESEVLFNAKTNVLYLLNDGTFHEFKLDYRSQDVIAQGLTEEEYKISPNGNMIAYIDKTEENSGSKIILQNLKKEEELEVTGEEGETLIPLGFIGSDFIYGVTKSSDAGETISGEKVFPMYKLDIVNAKGEIEMSYEKPGKYILSASIEDNMITVSLGTVNAKVYSPEREDYITNNESEEESKVYLESYVTELKERQRRLTFAEGLEDTNPKILTANQTLSSEALEFVLEGRETSDKYQVYAYGELYGKYGELSEAIQAAKEHTGVVVDAGLRCIWEMSNRDLNYVISQENKVVPALLKNLDEGMTPMEAAEAVDGAVCVDLTGCAAEDILYIINQDIPVIAMTSSKKAIVLTGYNEISIFYQTPGKEERKSVSYEKMDEMTKKSGNTYIGVK